MIKNLWNKILVGLGIVVVLLQIFILGYIYKKNGGTTGGDPVTPVFPFAVSLVISLFIFIRESKIFSRTLSLAVYLVVCFHIGWKGREFWFNMNGGCKMKVQ
jgi:hypothetical protein